MEQFDQFFDLTAVKFNAQIAAGMIAIWLVLLGCVVSSINSRPFTEKERRFWIMLVVLVPVFGVLAYIPFSFRYEDLPPFLMPRRHDKRRRRRRTSRPMIEAAGDTKR